MKNHTTNETTSKHANLPQHSNNETSTVGATSLPSSSLTLSDHNNPNTNVTKTTTTTTEHVISNPQHTISSSNITHGTSNSSNVVPPKRELSHRLLPLPTPPSQKQQQQPHSSHPSHQVVTSSPTSFHFSSDDENTNPTITKSDSEDKYKKTDHEMRKVQSARNSSAGTLLNSLIHPTHATTLGEQNNSKKENQLQNKASSSASTSSKFEQHQNPIGSAVATGVHKSIKNLGEALHAYHFEIVKVENIGKKLLHLRNHHHNKNNSNTDHHHTMTNNSNTLTTTVSTTNHTVVGTSENVNNISTENNVSTTTTTTATNSPRGTNTETISIKIEPHNEQQSCTVPVVSSPSQQQVSSSSTNNNNSSTTAALTSTNSTTKESPPQPALSPHSPPTLTSPSPRTMRKHSSMRDDIVSAFVKGPHSEDFDLAQFSSIVNNDSISQQALTTSSASTPRSLPSSSNSFLPSHQHHEIKYSLLMTKSESLCMDCKNINCKCVLISVPTSCIPGQEQDEQNTMVAFEMVGTVLLTTSRILFLIDEDSAVEASSPESQNLQKIIEILLSNVEYIEKNTEKERSMCIVEKSPMNPREGDMDPPPIKFIKKYEFFGFESHTTFQRAFKTFNDMLNVIRTMESETTLEGTTSVETNNLSNDGGNRKATPSSNTFNDASEKKLSVTTSKRERYTRKRVSVANTFHDLPSNYSIGSNVRKFLSPLEEALTNNFSMVDRKLLTPPSKKTVALAETKHRRSLSLSSPVVYEAGASKAGTTSSNKPGGSSISESGDDDKRTVISEGAVSIGGGAESSADEAESKRRSKKREKRQSLAIPTLVVDPPSQEFDDQFDGMVDEVAHFADDVPSIEPNDIFAVADQKSSQVKMKEVVSKKFMGISAEELFQACFSNASTFLVKVHEKLGDTGVELYDWVDFQYGAPTVRGITYKIGGSSPNHFSSFTQTAIRVLETQRVVLAKNTSKDKPMSYFILFTSAATQDMANNQMFQFDVKYIVKDTKPLNLLMNKECEIEICAGTQCKGGSIFWRSKSTESSVMKAIKNRLMVELDLMNETVEAIVNAKKNALSEQRLKSWEASVMSTISSLDGGFPKEMPSLNNLLPPPLCVESSPPPSPRDGDGDMSESLATNEDEDELTCGSTTSAVPNTPHSEFSGGENESSSQRRVKVVGFSSTSHLTVLPPPRISVASPSTPTLFPPGSNNEGSNLVRVRKTSLLDTSPTFANNFVVPTTSEAQHTVEGEAKQSNEITCIDSSVTNGTSSNMEMHSSLTITDMRPDQIKQLDPILLLLWELLISMCKSIFNVLSTVFEYAVNYFLEPVLTFSWNFKDIVSGVIIVFLILVFMYGNHSITNRVNNLAMETGQIHKELKNKFILARNMVHRIQDSSHMNSTQLQSSLRDIMKDYLVEHRKLSRKVEQHDLMKSLRDFRAKLKENVKR